MVKLHLVKENNVIIINENFLTPRVNRESLGAASKADGRLNKSMGSVTSALGHRVGNPQGVDTVWKAVGRLNKSMGVGYPLLGQNIL